MKMTCHFVQLQQTNIKQFNDVLNIDEYNNIDDNVLTSGIFCSEEIIVEVVKPQEQEITSDSDLVEEIVLETQTHTCAAESLQKFEEILKQWKIQMT